MRRRPICSLADDAVMGEVNTTPLIDVMLVLLILCVISIPIMDHKVSIRLPTDGLEETQLVHHLAMDSAGRLRWNNVPTTLAELPRYLEQVERNPDSTLVIGTSGAARYEDFDRMLSVVKRSGVERITFQGHETFVGAIDG